MNNKIKSFTISPIAFGADTIFKINNSNNLFFISYIFCDDMFERIALYISNYLN